MGDVTRILADIEQGDPQAAEQLLPLVYDELRKLAAQKMAQENPGQTLQATAHLRRYSLRTDGFVTVNAPYDGGELLTKPLVFSGKELTLNFATSAAGSVRAEITNSAGLPPLDRALPGAVEMIGNDIDRVVHWKTGSDVSHLAGKPVRLRLVLKDADVYALRFA